MRKTKKAWIASFILSLMALIVGASFHDYRMHPENVSQYNLGVTMGIVMISLFALFLVIGFVCLYLDRKKR